jgi:hypothetical protein
MSFSVILAMEIILLLGIKREITRDCVAESNDICAIAITGKVSRCSPKRSSPKMSIDLQALHEFAISLAKRAGTLIREASATRLSNNAQKTGEKLNCTPLLLRRLSLIIAIDLVTETDQVVEEMIWKSIAEHYPGHK